MKNTDRMHDNKLDYQDDDDGFGRIGELLGKLSSDVGNLFTLRIDLLKAELREGTKTFARDSTMMVVGGILAFFAFGAITLALIAFLATVLPMAEGKAFALAALLVGLAYAIISGLLVFLGLKHLQKRGIKPERSIEETRRDKEWMKEIKH